MRQLHSLAGQEAAGSQEDRLELQRTCQDLDSQVKVALGPPAEEQRETPGKALQEQLVGEAQGANKAAQEVQRLIAGRAGLLQTGVYKAGDPLIAALDSKLQALSSAAWKRQN